MKMLFKKDLFFFFSIMLLFFFCISIKLLYCADFITAEKPFLTIDSQGHSDFIKKILFTKDNRYLISASMDKTIRMWEISNGQQNLTMRGQIGRGLEGSIYNMDLSSNNEWLAVSGMMTECT